MDRSLIKVDKLKSFPSTDGDKKLQNALRAQFYFMAEWRLQWVIVKKRQEAGEADAAN